MAHRIGSHRHFLARADSSAYRADAPAAVAYVAHLAGFPTGAGGRQKCSGGRSALGLPRSCEDGLLPSVDQRMGSHFPVAADCHAALLGYGMVAGWPKNHGENPESQTGLARGEGRGVGATAEGQYFVTLCQQ